MAAVLDMTETLDTRVARLESDVAHIHSVVSDIKIDLRQLRTEFSALRDTTEAGFKTASAEMQQEFKAVRGEMQLGFAAGRTDLADLRREIHRRDWAFASVVITLFVALLGAMAQGFGWLH